MSTQLTIVCGSCVCLLAFSSNVYKSLVLIRYHLIIQYPKLTMVLDAALNNEQYDQ